MNEFDEHGINLPECCWVRSLLLSPWYVPTVVALAFAVRLCWILVVRTDPVSDFAFYFHSGESIARGYGYSHVGGSPTAYFPVGYSLFLGALFWIFGNSVAVAQTANAVLSVASVILAYRIARVMFRSELAGRLALLLLAMYPDNIAYTSLVGVETLHLLLLFLGMALMFPAISNKRDVHRGRLLIVGLVFGFATLAKAQTFLLPALLLLLFPQFSWEWESVVDRMKKIAILYVAMVAVLIPWVIRNHRLYNDFVFSNNDGLNLYIGNGPEANGTFVTIPWFDVGDDTRKEYEVNQYARREAIDYIKAHPVRTLSLMPEKVAALFDRGDGVYWNMMGAGSKSSWTQRALPLLDQVNAVYEVIVILLFIVSLAFGCWERLRHGKGHGWPLLGIMVVVYFIGIYLVYFGAARFHFPIIPWMVMYAAAMLTVPFTRSVRRCGAAENGAV